MGNGLNEAYNFDSYVVRRDNELAHKACLVVASNPGNYNPLFIVGGSGLGKTHLLHAIGNYIGENTSLGVRYLSAKDFPNNPQKIADLDVLLVDDIQLLSSRREVQESFVQGFNVLHSLRKQVVVAGTQYPWKMSSLSDRLKSRLGGGLTVKIELPEKVLTSGVGYSVEDIQRVVAYFFNIEKVELLSSRKRKGVYPRQISMYLCYKLTGASFPEIARQFRKKSHSTVVYAVSKIREELINNRQLNTTISDIIRLIER